METCGASLLAQEATPMVVSRRPCTGWCWARIWKDVAQQLPRQVMPRISHPQVCPVLLPSTPVPMDFFWLKSELTPGRKRMPEIGQSSHMAGEEWELFTSTLFLVLSLTYLIRTHPSKPGRTAACSPWNKDLGFSILYFSVWWWRGNFHARKPQGTRLEELFLVYGEGKPSAHLIR